MLTLHLPPELSLPPPSLAVKVGAGGTNEVGNPDEDIIVRTFSSKGSKAEKTSSTGSGHAVAVVSSLVSVYLVVVRCESGHLLLRLCGHSVSMCVILVLRVSKSESSLLPLPCVEAEGWQSGCRLGLTGAQTGHSGVPDRREGFCRDSVGVVFDKDRGSSRSA